MSEAMLAQTIEYTDADAQRTEAYLVVPTSGQEVGPRRGGVIVIHHFPGYDRGTKEIARRIADLGYDVILPNLYTRESADPVEAAEIVRAARGIADARLVATVAGAASYLRALDSSNGKVGVIGYCSGGRHTVLAACNVALDAAVDCYGAYVTGTPPVDFLLNITNLVDQLENLSCPLLGMFGNDDTAPTAAHVDDLAQRLDALGKPYEFHRYDGAGHAFFAVDRPAAYRAEAAADGWEHIATFFAAHLALGAARG